MPSKNNKRKLSMQKGKGPDMQTNITTVEQFSEKLLAAAKSNGEITYLFAQMLLKALTDVQIGFFKKIL